VTSPKARAKGPRNASSEATIAAVANELRVAPQVVKDLYDEEIAQLQSNAAVTNFIEVIAGRRVKARLRNTRIGG
jgi:hypothetical protein